MGWRSDWLYRLVFAEVDRVWQHALCGGQTRFGPAPDALLVREVSEVDWDVAMCGEGARRAWVFRGGVPEPLPANSSLDVGERRGMFYERGTVGFHVAADRRRVLLTYTLGPR